MRQVAILLSTFEGAPFLPAQLASYAAQTGVDWRLYWRDDGSTDASVAALEAFAKLQHNRCVRVGAPGHIGVMGSYMVLLRAAMADGATTIAFSDQDDVWLPHKLSRGLSQLGPDPAPALYCSRQILVDAALQPVGHSAPIRVPPGLGPALTQNIATGCTVMLNTAAAALVAHSRPPPPTLHDWWSYLAVSAAGGRVVFDPEPGVLYRQHAGNAVGAPRSTRQRAIAALKRGPGAYMSVLRAHLAALQAQPELLSPDARSTVDAVASALGRRATHRLRVLQRHDLHRQTWPETALFRCWFLIG